MSPLSMSMVNVWPTCSALLNGRIASLRPPLLHMPHAWLLLLLSPAPQFGSPELLSVDEPRKRAAEPLVLGKIQPPAPQPLPRLRQKYDSGEVPLAVTEKLALPPTQAAMFVGFAETLGAVFTVNEALQELLHPLR